MVSQDRSQILGRSELDLQRNYSVVIRKRRLQAASRGHKINHERVVENSAPHSGLNNIRKKQIPGKQIARAGRTPILKCKRSRLIQHETARSARPTTTNDCSAVDD